MAIPCVSCGTRNVDEARFCDACGTLLVRPPGVYCTACGLTARVGARFCRACGTRLRAAPALPAPPAAEPADRTEPAAPPDAQPEPASSVAASAAAEAVPVGPAPPRAETPAAGGSPGTAEVGAALSAPPPRDEAPPPPRRSAGDTAREWAAARQADILLYLGAFLLVAAALLFVGSRGEAIAPGLRVAILLVYTWAFIVAGLAARRSTRIREAGMVFLAIGALITPLNFLLMQAELLDERGVPDDVVWLVGSVYCAVFYGALQWRGLGRLYAVPAGLAVVSGWAALAAVVNLPGAWYGVWWIAFVDAVSAIAIAAGRYTRRLAAVAAALHAAIFLVQLALLDGDRVEVPVSLALVAAWLAATGRALREPALLPAFLVVLVGALTSGLWAADLDRDWYAYPALAVGLALVWSRRWWAHWSLTQARLGWGYAALGGLSPVPLVESYAAGAHGAASFLLGAVVLASIAWRDERDGIERVDEGGEPGAPTTVSERTFWAWIAFALLLTSVGYAQRELGIERPNTGWAYMVLAVAPVALIAWTGRRWQPALAALTPPALAAVVVSLADPDAYPGHDAMLLAVPAGAFAVAFALTWRWPLTLVAAVLAALAAAAAWRALEWPTWTLAAAYSAAGVVLFAVLARLRRYAPDSRSAIVSVLSWGFVVLGPATAGAALLPIEDVQAPAVLESGEYRATFYLLIVAAALITFEGWRLRHWSSTVAGTALAAVAVAPLWPSYDWPTWTLALAYLGVGVVRFAITTRARTYEPTPQQGQVLVLSWGLVLAAGATAWTALVQRMDHAGVAVETVEYLTFVAIVFALVPLGAFEGWRLRRLRRLALAGVSVLSMGTLLLAIAAWGPGSIQAYTIPQGVYLVLCGLVVRRSAQLLERHLMLHEAVLLLGVGYILGPQVELGLRADGAEWGFVILAEGALFVTIGLVLDSRWLSVSGVLAISAVAIRWLAVNTGEAIPYWLTLGGVGMLLLAIGTAMLFGREQWVALREGATGWWRRTAAMSGPRIPTEAIAAPIAVLVIGFFAAGPLPDWETPASTVPNPAPSSAVSPGERGVPPQGAVQGLPIAT